MAKVKPVEKGHVVMEFELGATKVTICDDYCSYPDQAERNAAIRKRLGEIAMRAAEMEALKQQK